MTAQIAEVKSDRTEAPIIRGVLNFASPMRSQGKRAGLENSSQHSPEPFVRSTKSRLGDTANAALTHPRIVANAGMSLFIGRELVEELFCSRFPGSFLFEQRQARAIVMNLSKRLRELQRT